MLDRADAAIWYSLTPFRRIERSFLEGRGVSGSERDVPVTLHRCSLTGFKSRFHPCWRVESALRDQGIEYTRVTQMGVPKSRRTAVIAGTGQKKFPAIEFEDGTWYRAESNDMAARIRAGHLFDTD